MCEQLDLHGTRADRAHDRAKGFTILELLVASTVFSVILVVVAVGVVQFTNSYYKGVNSSKVQLTARSIMAEVSQSVQFGQSPQVTTGSGGAGWLCVNNTLYSYKLGQEVIDASPNAGLHQGFHGLVVSDNGTSCVGQKPALPNTGPLSSASRELLGEHMRLGVLTITPNGDLYTIRVRVLYGEDDLFTSTNWSSAQCAGSRPGVQFCAVSDLTTTVQRRLL